MNKKYLLFGIFVLLFLVTGCSRETTIIPLVVSSNSSSTGDCTCDFSREYNTTSELSNLFYPLSNPFNFVNTSLSLNGSIACSGSDKLSNVTLSSNVLSGVCSADQSGGSTPLYWGSFTYNYVLEDDMCGVLTTTGKDWYWTAIASGTTAASTGYITHPCTRSISSSATASSGGAFNIGILNLLLSGNESTDIIFSKVAKTGNISNVHMGFLDSVTATEPVDGVYVQIHNLTLNGVVRTNNVETNTSTNFNVSADAWYRVRVEIFNTTHAHFYLYNSTTTTGTGNTVLLWSNEINTLLPSASSRQLGNGVTTWVTGSTTAVALIQVDYMNLMINKTLVR